MIELSATQCQELNYPEPLAIDPGTKKTYVLLPKAVYDRMKRSLALDDYDPDEGAAYVSEVMSEDDAKDPLLENYQHYGKRP